MLMNPRYGKVGVLAFPYYFFLEVFGPIIESVGYVTFLVALVLGRASMPFVLAFLAVAFAFGIALSFAAIGLEELSFRRYPRFGDLIRLLGVAIVENVGYRQLSTYWRVKGMVSKLTGATAWGAMERKGFQAPSTGPA